MFWNSSFCGWDLKNRRNLPGDNIRIHESAGLWFLEKWFSAGKRQFLKKTKNLKLGDVNGVKIALINLIQCKVLVKWFIEKSICLSKFNISICLFLNISKNGLNYSENTWCSFFWIVLLHKMRSLLPVSCVGATWPIKNMFSFAVEREKIEIWLISNS